MDTEPQQVGGELSTYLLIKIISKTTGYRESYLELLYNLPWWSSCPIFDISISNSNFNYDYEYKDNHIGLFEHTWHYTVCFITMQTLDAALPIFSGTIQ